MPESKHLQELAGFIREHRSNEANFEKLYAKLEEETNLQGSNTKYQVDLLEIKEKEVEEYKIAKEKTGSAWPEFEKFVTGFERVVIKAEQE